MKKILILVGILFLLTGCEKEISLEKEFTIMTNEKENCENISKEYYKKGNQKIFLVCLDEVKFKTEDGEMTLKTYLKKQGSSIDSATEKITSLLKYDNGLFDGGTAVYKSNDMDKTAGLTVIKCDTVEGNNDVYIGTKDLDLGAGLEKGFCGY